MTVGHPGHRCPYWARAGARREAVSSKAFCDGSYSVRGNELTLIPDKNGQPETYVIRLEQESRDGQHWTAKLYMMMPQRVTCLDGSRIEDNEIGLSRLP